MSPQELQDKIKITADRLYPTLKDVSREDLELILWNIFREKKDPFDFLLKAIAPNKWAR